MPPTDLLGHTFSRYLGLICRVSQSPVTKTKPDLTANDKGTGTMPESRRDHTAERGTGEKRDTDRSAVSSLRPAAGAQREEGQGLNPEPRLKPVSPAEL